MAVQGLTQGHIALVAKMAELGLSQADTARLLGLDSGAMSRLVRGDYGSRMTVALARRIEAELAIPVAAWDTPPSTDDTSPSPARGCQKKAG